VDINRKTNNGTKNTHETLHTESAPLLETVGASSRWDLTKGKTRLKYKD